MKRTFLITLLVMPILLIFGSAKVTAKIVNSKVVVAPTKTALQQKEAATYTRQKRSLAPVMTTNSWVSKEKGLMMFTAPASFKIAGATINNSGYSFKIHSDAVLSGLKKKDPSLAATAAHNTGSHTPYLYAEMCHGTICGLSNKNKAASTVNAVSEEQDWTYVRIYPLYTI